jgi:monofunctional glycosyltransferase
MRKFLRRMLWVCLAPLLLYLCVGLFLYRWVLPPATPLMVIRSVERDRIVDYRPLRSSHIAPVLARSVVAAEDSRFCLHNGVDMDAVREAMEDYNKSGRLRGASTITMQVARNIFLWPGGGAARKAVEVPLALALDALWPKQRIIEVYLNIAEWGPGVFGAEAAARHHFSVGAMQLDSLQAARLAAVLPSPRYWSPSRPGNYVRARTRLVLRESTRLGKPYVECLRYADTAAASAKRR